MYSRVFAFGVGACYAFAVLQWPCAIRGLFRLWALTMWHAGFALNVPFANYAVPIANVNFGSSTRIKNSFVVSTSASWAINVLMGLSAVVRRLYRR